MSDSRRYFDVDDRGRTVLFHFAMTDNRAEVERVIFSLPGTGLSGERRALICHKDDHGKTAIDVAAQAGHEGIADLLQGELDRMDMFE